MPRGRWPNSRRSPTAIFLCPTKSCQVQNTAPRECSAILTVWLVLTSRGPPLDTGHRVSTIRLGPVFHHAVEKAERGDIPVPRGVRRSKVNFLEDQ